MMDVLSPGALTTVQDAGRRGYAALGYAACGAADKYAMRLANLLAGNGAESGAAVLEFTLMGPTLRFDAPAWIALTGAAFSPRLNGEPAPMFRPLWVRAGDTLALGAAARGLRGYLAVYGGVDVPPVLGSRSTDLKCHIGGAEGRALRAGDRLSAGTAGPETEAACGRARTRTEAPGFPDLTAPGFASPAHPWRFQGALRVPVLRAVMGPQEEAFTAAGLETFAGSVYTLTPDCNRMACKLDGPAIETVRGSDILSDGIAEGSVQVSSDGRPIVMLADHQTTGGYAKIATVIGPDIAVLAQLRPGETAAFRFVTPEEAVAACRREADKLQWLEGQIL